MAATTTPAQFCTGIGLSRTAAMSCEQLQVPRVDFRGLSSGLSGGNRWDAVRAEAMAALQAFGCFEAVYDAVSPEIKEEIFFRAMPALFALPKATKMANQSSAGLPNEGYVGQIPGFAYESLCIKNPHCLECVEHFASLMWPGGNPTFSDAIRAYGKPARELEQMVEWMILQSMGVEKYYDSLTESLSYILRLSEYGAAVEEENKVALPEHFDNGMITIVCQYQMDGLEMHTRDGEWIPVVSQPNSFTVMLGETYRAWSNGRLQAPLHRVRLPRDQTRYSLVFATQPKKDSIIQAPKELIDEENPQRFRPFKYDEFIRFCSLEEGRKSKNPLQPFAAVEGA